MKNFFKYVTFFAFLFSNLLTANDRHEFDATFSVTTYPHTQAELAQTLTLQTKAMATDKDWDASVSSELKTPEGHRKITSEASFKNDPSISTRVTTSLDTALEKF